MRPNFFIIGAAKAGTTALHDQLDTHPDIQMSSIKETNFYAPVDNSTRGRHFTERVESREAYEALFDDGIRMRGESSPSYAMEPRRPGVASRIASDVPDARFIYLVRDPIARIRAQHLQRMSVGECGSFEEMLGDLEAPVNDYLCASLYMSQIDSYLEHFDRDRILVLEQEELRTQGESTIREVFAFLGVDPSHTVPDENQSSNLSDGKREFSAIYSRISGNGLIRRAYESLPATGRSRVTGLAGRLLRKPAGLPDLDEATVARLSDKLKPDADRLREFTGKALSHWSV